MFQKFPMFFFSVLQYQMEVSLLYYVIDDNPLATGGYVSWKVLHLSYHIQYSEVCHNHLSSISNRVLIYYSNFKKATHV